ncbi:hypothetical protein [Streptosporangium subroseum]|nr:hypothetical protein [Streptosporangium subroseum]
MTKTVPARDSALDTAAHRQTRSARIVAALVHRWPTWLAIAFAAVLSSDLDDGREFAFLVFILALGYLATAVIDRPGAIWSVLGVLMAAVVLMRVLSGDPWPILIVTALALIMVGLVRGQLRRPGAFALQSPAMFVFGAIALGALHVHPDLGRYLVAAGLLGHAAWDAAHWRADGIVTRPFAEWCGVLDLLLGLAVLFLA